VNEHEALDGARQADPEFLAELQTALHDLMPDLRLVDRGLVLGAESQEAGSMGEEMPEPSIGDLLVDWVAVDPRGRLNLVVWLGSDRSQLPAEPVDMALEILHRSRRQWPFILRHLGPQGVRAESEPRLILVATHFTEATVRKLAVLGSDRVGLLEVHEIRTDSGASHHLVHRWPLQGEGEPGGPDAFLLHLHQELRPLAQSLLQRLQRVDERLVLLGSGAELLEWSLGNQPVCWLEQGQGGLQGRTGNGAVTSLVDGPTADAFLEDVLRRYFEVVEADEEEDDADKTSLVSQGMGLVLSEDELNAFL